MLNMYLLLSIMTLSVIGIYCIVKELTSLILKNNIGSQVVLEINDNADGVENAVRHALAANPASDIVIIDKSENDEISKILKHLSFDYERVHIQQKTPES